MIVISDFSIIKENLVKLVIIVATVVNQPQLNALAASVIEL